MEPVIIESNAYRRELKFVLDPAILHELIHLIKMHPAGFTEIYAQRQINNVYFDSHEYSAFQASTEGLSVRSKVRYRWYGNTDAPQPGTLEVKLRRNHLGTKLSYPVTEVPESCLRSWREFCHCVRHQLPPEGQKWLLEYPVPVLINRYLRRYFLTGDGLIRITLDWAHRVYDQRMKPAPNYRQSAHVPQSLVMEVKYAAELGQEDVSDVLSYFPFYMSRHSKYTLGMESLAHF